MSKIAFLYPGQGAQCAGMGADFYEHSPLAREVFDLADELLGLDMKSLCFEENDRLDLTEYTQAAMVTTCLAMTKVLEHEGLVPDITAGLSLGEYCAIAAAGGMSIGDAIRTVRVRGLLMQNTVPSGEGAMAAILGMKGEKIEEVLKDIEQVTIANYNSPGQIVITGETKAVEAACQSLKEAGAKRAVFLNVSGPFHSPLLNGAKEELAHVLDSVSFSPLRIPYVTNVTAKEVTDISETKQLLTTQMCAPVRWQQSMEYMIENGVDTFIEIGPGKTLTGFLKKINRNVKFYNISSWGDIETVIQSLGKDFESENTFREAQVC